MNSLVGAIENTISISLFNRGLAGKIFSDVRRTGAKVVMKNNAPECVLLSPEEYVQLMDAVNDAKLLSLAAERLEGYDADKVISAEDVNRHLNVTDEDLADYGEVEFE